MRPQALLLCFIVITASLLPVATAAADAGNAEWRFRVLLDDREIGYHEFSVERDGERRILRTQAQFDVKFLFVTAFRYRHRNEEIWRGDCLASLDAFTDSNGRELAVAGQRGEQGFAVSTPAGAETLPGCVASFAYWNPAILGAERLLNSQTGEYEPVEVMPDGEEQLPVGGRLVDAERYRLTAKAGDITLWYAKEGRRWLALEAPAKGGRRIRYEPLAVPPADAVDRLIASAATPGR